MKISEVGSYIHVQGIEFKLTEKLIVDGHPIVRGVATKDGVPKPFGAYGRDLDEGTCLRLADGFDSAQAVRSA